MKYLTWTMFCLLLVSPQLNLWAHAGHDEQKKDPTPDALSTKGAPKLSLATDESEVVAVYKHGQLFLYLDEFSSNKPVNDAEINIELQGKEYIAKSEADGTYVVEIPLLKQAGDYELVITIQANDLEDLLMGTIHIPSTHAETDYMTGWDVIPLWAYLLIIAVIVIVAAFFANRRFKKVQVSAAMMSLSLILYSLPDSAFAHAGHGPEEAAELPSLIGVDKPQVLPGGNLHLPKPTQRLLVIRTQVATVADVSLTIQLAGHVIPDPNHHGSIQASLDGRIDVNGSEVPYVGQWVKSGQLLSQLIPIAERFDQANQQAQLAELSSALDVAKKRLERLEQLTGSVPRKTLIKARNEVKSLTKSRKAVGKSLGGFESLFAPVNGYITRAHVTPGMIVEARDVLYEIINPKYLRVEALAYNINRDVKIQSAFGVTNNGTTVPLKILGISSSLKGHALPMLFQVDMPDPPLVVQQVLKVYITSDKLVNGVLLPLGSITRDRKGKDIVWVHSKPEQFEPRRVSWQPADAKNIVVKSGIKSGDRVVTMGATLLSEIR
jgi:cobalt-zinc-cadmium efflux system membrane fusion protein